MEWSIEEEWSIKMELSIKLEWSIKVEWRGLKRIKLRIIFRIPPPSQK